VGTADSTNDGGIVCADGLRVGVSVLRIDGLPVGSFMVGDTLFTALGEVDTILVGTMEDGLEEPLVTCTDGALDKLGTEDPKRDGNEDVVGAFDWLVEGLREGEAEEWRNLCLIKSHA
jgi:hypothetical protein